MKMFQFYNEERHQQANSFAWLLGAQLFLVLFPPIFDYLHWPWITALGVVFVLFSSVYISTTTKRQLINGLLIALLATILLFIDAPNASEAPGAAIGTKILAYFTIIVVLTFFMYVGIALAKQVYKVGKVNLNTLLAAISGYMLIGIAGGYLVRLVQIFAPGSFNIESSQDGYSYMYFSFVTMTTLGYGDFSPQETVGQAVAIILVIAGQMYLTVVIALIVGEVIAKRK